MIFFDIEKEGKYKGLKTLFVGSSCDVDKIQRLAFRHECEHIYLGAGRSYINTLTDEDIVRLISLRFKISLETLDQPILDEKTLAQINVIYTIHPESFPIDLSWLRSNHTIKIEDENFVLCFKMSDVYLTGLKDLKGNHYEDDVILEE